MAPSSDGGTFTWMGTVPASSSVSEPTVGRPSLPPAWRALPWYVGTSSRGRSHCDDRRLGTGFTRRSGDLQRILRQVRRSPTSLRTRSFASRIPDFQPNVITHISGTPRCPLDVRCSTASPQRGRGPVCCVCWSARVPPRDRRRGRACQGRSRARSLRSSRPPTAIWVAVSRTATSPAWGMGIALLALAARGTAACRSGGGAACCWVGIFLNYAWLMRCPRWRAIAAGDPLRAAASFCRRRGLVRRGCSRSPGLVVRRVHPVRFAIAGHRKDRPFPVWAWATRVGRVEVDSRCGRGVARVHLKMIRQRSGCTCDPRRVAGHRLRDLACSASRGSNDLAAYNVWLRRPGVLPPRQPMDVGLNVIGACAQPRILTTGRASAREAGQHPVADRHEASTAARPPRRDAWRSPCRRTPTNHGPRSRRFEGHSGTGRH